MVGYYRLKDAGYRLEAGAQILPRRLVEPMDAATRLIDDAREVADGIAADASAEFERQKKQGFEVGLSEVRRQAVERLLAESCTLDRSIASMEGELAELVISCVRKLVDGFNDNARATALVRAALKQMRRETRAEIRVSCAQYEPMRRAVSDIVADFTEVVLIDVVEDVSLGGSQVIVETSIGRVEADMELSLDDLCATIRTAVSESDAVSLQQSDKEPGT